MLVSKRLLSTTFQPRFLDKFFKPVVEASNPRKHEVKTLIRPVGLVSPPTPHTKYSKGNSFKDLFDEEKTAKRTEELSREMSYSAMYDMHTFRQTNGKLFLSPKAYWRKDRALYFPHIVGKSLANKKLSIEEVLKGKLSVVRMFSNSAGNDLTLQYLKRIQNTKELQFINIHWVENVLKSAIVKLSKWNIKNNVPKESHKDYFICSRSQLPFTIRDELKINNMYTGYLFLVDKDLKIRWLGCGGATTLDQEILANSIEGLLKE
ncbi:hypothetical protein KAFR_0A05930 [Kazachstania africana CBS 2517]|uniref:Mitochondrial ATPase complex subunit ATP10 n=1 Tax=Kazachstania africana (strain ATCC 22294 / BCRC 22015 / CBS 2517 / CECT 1963 / NBRC 1671 / NRRL Y-8276) TaxID=1071382 RepID=H2ANS8_KAZAF|nr:hypothetical protein KAFR_0A05930 [Kazachstania africana CBS 2517]CCF56028.1 hypothetical protein KAFR_0A05930 [Kazachstania africana CBS 2517]